MNRYLGLVVLAAGCALQPAGIQDARAGVDPIPAAPTLRVGVEFLSPEKSALANQASHALALRTMGLPANRHARLPQPAQVTPLPVTAEQLYDLPDEVLGKLEGEPVPPWRMDREDLARVDSASERMTWRFLKEMMGRDGQRIDQQLGAAFLERQHMRALDVMPETFEEEALHADQDEAFQNIAMHLVRRPARRALKELPLVSDMDVAIESFKAENVPTSGAYQESHNESKRHWGRVSVRFRYNNGSDPIELAYVQRGWRFGVSQETLKTSYSSQISDQVWFSVGSRYDYERSDLDMSAELRFQVDSSSRIRLIVGNQMDPFPGSALDQHLYGFTEGEPSVGAMLFMETTF